MHTLRPHFCNPRPSLLCSVHRAAVTQPERVHKCDRPVVTAAGGRGCGGALPVVIAAGASEWLVGPMLGFICAGWSGLRFASADLAKGSIWLSSLGPNVGRRRSAVCFQMLVGGFSVLLPNVGRRRSTVCCQMLVSAAQ
eukprot:347601-Chlamydomonas_euryale.AAC.1